MTEDPAKRWLQATGIPFSSRPAEIRSNQIRPIHIVLDIFLTGPHDLDGTVDLFGDLNSASDAVDLQATAEAAADQMIVHHDLVQRQASHLGRGRLSSRDGLAADPDFAAVRADVNGAVHRLHRRVREKRNLVDRLDLGDGTRHRLVDIADVLRNRPQDLSVACSSSRCDVGRC